MKNTEALNLLFFAALLFSYLGVFAQNTPQEGSRTAQVSKVTLPSENLTLPATQFPIQEVSQPVNINPNSAPKRLDPDTKIPDFKEQRTMPAITPRNPRNTSTKQ